MKHLLTALAILLLPLKLFSNDSIKSPNTLPAYLDAREYFFTNLTKLYRSDPGASDRLAILMETELTGDYTTLIAFEDAASLYCSKRFNPMLSSKEPNISSAAKSLLELSRKYDVALKKADEFPLPKPGMVRFYIITKTQTLSGEFEQTDLKDRRLPISELFYKANELSSSTAAEYKKHVSDSIF